MPSERDFWGVKDILMFSGDLRAAIGDPLESALAVPEAMPEVIRQPCFREDSPCATHSTECFTHDSSPRCPGRLYTLVWTLNHCTFLLLDLGAEWDLSGYLVPPSFDRKGNQRVKYLLKAKLWSRVVVESCL